ncbi:4'-phosphopantetheinyl transferase family protein [Luteibacter yeojuensis]|uniref:4'-phosphopantetheinyl transferase superfamily protein n=1 Tax=Luteibacter yeojuensis TaxID=345309 RepID=A0A7X5QWA7_9GAMM|nr:4'-phosphopantetheinyl transferase superfamily protein [Luteibacter yeojuensis]NID16551.1 4'-phosphopantetheinyl transferase superfamily protein [Luteibacter yeojuensis]
MIQAISSVPFLEQDEIHIWRCRWAGGAGEQAFAGILRRYLGDETVPVERGEHGKPHFAAPHDTLGFNWSHSGDVALLALGRGPAGFEVGVDVETVRPRARALELSQRFFAPPETARLRALPEAARLHGFLTLWTAKEAVLKAHGGGLSYGLHRVSFSLNEEGAVPEVFEGDVGAAAEWQVRPLALDEGLVSAVAWRGEKRALRVFTFPL